MNPANYSQKMFAQSSAIANGTVVVPNGWIPAAADGTPYRGDPNAGNLPAQMFEPVFSGGWPAYNNGPQQLGFMPGQY